MGWTRYRSPFIAALVAFQSMSKVDTFKELARKATEKLEHRYNAPDIVPFASQMVEIAKGDPDNRLLYSRVIIEFWEQKGIEEHVIEFCCHALQWQELSSYFAKKYQEAKAEEDWLAWQSLRHIMDSFSPDWEDATDFYAEYFSN